MALVCLCYDMGSRDRQTKLHFGNLKRQEEVQDTSPKKNELMDRQECCN